MGPCGYMLHYEAPTHFGNYQFSGWNQDVDPAADTETEDMACGCCHVQGPKG